MLNINYQHEINKVNCHCKGTQIITFQNARFILFIFTVTSFPNSHFLLIVHKGDETIET